MITPGKDNHAIRLGDKTFDNFIVLDQNLSLNRATFRNPFKRIQVNRLNVKNLTQNENSKIFNKDLGFIIKDTVLANEINDEIISKKTFLGDLIVDQFLLSETNPYKKEINNFDNFEKRDFNYTGDLQLNNEIFVKNLYLGGQINGIDYRDLSNALLSEFDQVRLRFLEFL